MKYDTSDVSHIHKPRGLPYQVGFSRSIFDHKEAFFDPTLMGVPILIFDVEHHAAWSMPTKKHDFSDPHNLAGPPQNRFRKIHVFRSASCSTSKIRIGTPIRVGSKNASLWSKIDFQPTQNQKQCIL